MREKCRKNFDHDLFGCRSLRLLAICAAGTAFTLDSQISVAQDANGVAALEEVIVTAQRRVESAQEIPKAVEVLSEGALARAGVTNLQDLRLISPSIQGTSTNGSPPSIRGISSFAYSIGVQAQTGVVLDDVPQPNFSTLADELSDVQRVEVLPGPQSTLSGRNAAGGLINVVTRSPTDTLTGSFTGEATDDQQKRVAGYVTGPISDQLGFSLSGFYNDWDGPLRNIATDSRLGGYERSGIRGKLQFKPTENFSATLTAFYTHNSAGNSALVGGFPYVTLSNNATSFFLPTTPLNNVLQINARPGNNELYSAHDGGLSSNDKGATLHLDYDTSFGTLTSITNFSKSSTSTETPLTAFSFFPDIRVIQNYNVDYKTQEFRLGSPKDNGRFNYLIGLIYSDTKIFEPYQRALIAPVDWNRTSQVKSTALYGRGTYAILPQTFVTLGLRAQKDDQSYDWQFLDGIAPRSRGSNTYNFGSGEFSVRQELTHDVSVYATYANAQTGRAYDLEDQVAAATPAGLRPVDSEHVQSYEVGFKSQWLDRRLTLNASVFDQRYKNYQIQQAFLPAPGQLASIRLLAIGRVESRGLEFDSAFAATPDLQLSIAATLLDAKIRDYPDAICYTGQTLPSCAASPGTQGNLAGTTMPGASRFKGVASAAYTLRLSLPVDATFSAFYRYQSATHFDVLNDPVSGTGGFGIVNLSAGLQDHDARYTVQLFVNNVFDKNNYASLARDTIVFDTAGANPAAVYGSYARDWHRYAGVRFNLKY